MHKPIKDYELIDRFFEKQAEWLGLQRHAGHTLAALYIANDRSDGKLSAEDIAEMTGYSRSNSALALTQLEALGLVQCESDVSQSGRGRKRILYFVSSSVQTPIELSLTRISDMLHAAISDLSEIETLYGDELPSIMKMFQHLKSEAKTIIGSIDKIDVK